MRLGQQISCALLLVSPKVVSFSVHVFASPVSTCLQILEQIGALESEYFLFQRIRVIATPPFQ